MSQQDGVFMSLYVPYLRRDDVPIRRIHYVSLNWSCHINVRISSFNIYLSILLGILTSQTNETIPTLMGHV